MTEGASTSRPDSPIRLRPSGQAQSERQAVVPRCGRPDAQGPPTVLELGTAAVRDSDLQANTDRYLERSLRKIPAAIRQAPWFVLGAQSWYWTRMWIEVTPVKIMWWQHKKLDDPPRVWEADGIEPKRSDPRPPGRTPGPWQKIGGGTWPDHATTRSGASAIPASLSSTTAGVGRRCHRFGARPAAVHAISSLATFSREPQSSH